MSEAIVRNVATAVESSNVRRGNQAEAVLREMSWALSYPSANIANQFRELLADRSVQDSWMKKCA